LRVPTPPLRGTRTIDQSKIEAPALLDWGFFLLAVGVLELAPAEASGHLRSRTLEEPRCSVPGLLLFGAPKHLQGFGMHIMAMNMFDIAAKLVVVGLVCAFVCYWLLRWGNLRKHDPAASVISPHSKKTSTV
jgi:hypothetical protein